MNNNNNSNNSQKQKQAKDSAIPEILNGDYHQPPEPAAKSFATLEEAKNYVADYLRFSHTLCVQNQHQNDIVYKCSELSKNSEQCAFSLIIRHDALSNEYAVSVAFPYHSHSIVSADSSKDEVFSVANFLMEYWNGNASLDMIINALVDAFPSSKLDFAVLTGDNGELFYSLAARFDAVFRYVYKLMFCDKITEYSAVEFFVASHFEGKMVLDESTVREYMAICEEFALFVGRLCGKKEVGVTSANSGSNANTNTNSNTNTSSTANTNSKLDPSLLDAATRATNLFSTPENIDPEISNAISDKHTDDAVAAVAAAVAATNNSAVNAAHSDMGYLSQAIAIQSLSNNMMESFKGTNRVHESSKMTHGANLAPPEQDFATMEDAKAYLKAYMNSSKVGLVIYKSGKNRGYALYRCERGGKPEENLVKRRNSVKHAAANVNEKGEMVDHMGKVIKRRNRQSRKIDCPFKVHILFDKKMNCFKLIVPSPEHNHPLGTTDLKYHPILRKRTEEHLKYMTELFLSGVKKPSDLKRKVQEKFPDLQIIDKDIYNDMRKIKMRIKELDQQLANANAGGYELKMEH